MGGWFVCALAYWPQLSVRFTMFVVRHGTNNSKNTPPLCALAVVAVSFDGLMVDESVR